MQPARIAQAGTRSRGRRFDLSRFLLQGSAQELEDAMSARAVTNLLSVTIRDLLRASGRHRSDRILLGQGRGWEALDLLQTVNIGFSGTSSTIPTNRAQQAVTRFASCVPQCGVDKLNLAVRLGSLKVTHLDRREGQRTARQILRVHRYDPITDQYAFAEASWPR